MLDVVSTLESFNVAKSRLVSVHLIGAWAFLINGIDYILTVDSSVYRHWEINTA
jgi:hypothetical protein